MTGCRRRAVYALLAAACTAPIGAAAQPAPLEHAHAHNDYQHARPLFSALERGFRSVEADVHLVDGQLLVGHLVMKPCATAEAGNKPTLRLGQRGDNR